MHLASSLSTSQVDLKWRCKGDAESSRPFTVHATLHMDDKINDHVRRRVMDRLHRASTRGAHCVQCGDSADQFDLREKGAD